jgi:transposase
MKKYSLGIDMSLKSFHFCLSVIEHDHKVKVKSSTTFSNTKEGFRLLVSWINKHYTQRDLPLSVVMEATGVYYEKCALYLFQAGYNVSVVLPNVAKKYLGSIGQKTKNDKIDAKGLSRMGAERALDKWEPMDDFFYTLRSYTRQHESLQRTKTILNNQRHAVENQAHPNKLVEEQLQNLIKTIDEQLKELSKAIDRHIKSNGEVWKKVQGICRVKGIGVLTVAVVIAETNGFALFKNIPQVVSYAGYDIVENQSGNRVGKTKISKHGNGHIRRALYMPSLHAAAWQGSVFQNLYQRIFERSNIKMKGYVAVQKKLLVTIYTLWKKNESYDKEYRLKRQQIKYTEEQEQVSPSLVSDEIAGKPIKKVVPVVPELHKVNIPMEPSQYVPSLVTQN